MIRNTFVLSFGLALAFGAGIASAKAGRADAQSRPASLQSWALCMFGSRAECATAMTIKDPVIINKSVKDPVIVNKSVKDPVIINR